MRATKIVAFTLASMFLLGGAVGAAAAVPADQATTNADAADGVGPSDLPDQAADHVSDIHDRIGSFLRGSIDDLGESLADLLGSGEQADQRADGESGA